MGAYSASTPMPTPADTFHEAANLANGDFYDASAAFRARYNVSDFMLTLNYS
jgi:hypothetical protein